jgi:hypothetical protein
MRAFGAEDHTLAEDAIICVRSPAVEKEQRFIPSDEVPYLGRKLDHSIRLRCLSEKLWDIYREDDAGSAAMQDRSRHRAGIVCRSLGALYIGNHLGIDTLHYRHPSVADPLDQTHRTQEPGRVVDKEQECRQADETQGARDKRDQLRTLVSRWSSALMANSSAKTNKANGVADDVVPQQRRRNDARCVLPARNLDGHQQ